MLPPPLLTRFQKILITGLGAKICVSSQVRHVAVTVPHFDNTQQWIANISSEKVWSVLSSSILQNQNQNPIFYRQPNRRSLSNCNVINPPC